MSLYYQNIVSYESILRIKAATSFIIWKTIHKHICSSLRTIYACIKCFPAPSNIIGSMNSNNSNSGYAKQVLEHIEFQQEQQSRGSKFGGFFNNSMFGPKK